VSRGVGQHLLAGAKQLLLNTAALVELSAHVGGAPGKRVADALELRQPEQAGAPAGRNRRTHRRSQRRELLVEPRDLLAQRASSCRVVDDERLENGGLFQKNRHPPIGAFGLKPQNTCVPSIPIRCTPTVLKTIDLAVAVPTPTGPPDAV
jgi:hypothetical protein